METYVSMQLFPWVFSPHDASTQCSSTCLFAPEPFRLGPGVATQCPSCWSTKTFCDVAQEKNNKPEQTHENNSRTARAFGPVLRTDLVRPQNFDFMALRAGGGVLLRVGKPVAVKKLLNQVIMTNPHSIDGPIVGMRLTISSILDSKAPKH
eukprot:1730684-Amphidinium_carterae.1